MSTRYEMWLRGDAFHFNFFWQRKKAIEEKFHTHHWETEEVSLLKEAYNPRKSTPRMELKIEDPDQWESGEKLFLVGSSMFLFLYLSYCTK